MKLAIAQIDPKCADLEGNAARMRAYATQAKEAGAQFVIFPAYALSGDPTGALTADSPAFVLAFKKAVKQLNVELSLPAMFADITADSMIEPTELSIYFCPRSGEEVETYCESDSANDELGFMMFNCCGMNFAPLTNGPAAMLDDSLHCVVEFAAREYHGPASTLDEVETQLDYLACAQASEAPYLVASLVGGFDNLVFAGSSRAYNPNQTTPLPVAKAASFAEDLLLLELTSNGIEPLVAQDNAEPVSTVESDYQAVVLATRDYFRKNGFSDCVVGLSGGIDSALIATIAVDALGAEHVHGVLMPSQYSSKGSVDDSLALAENLGIDTQTIAITEPFETFCNVLAPACGGEVKGLTRENLQARIRTIYLMALSNANGWILLNTGNKSECAMGFSTLYGDTAGAYAPLGDVYKTEVWEMARWRNTCSPAVPEEVITKEPSAELYDGARDADRLPEYLELDKVLFAHVELGMGRGELIAEGFNAALVDRVLPTVKANEFKRRQEPMAPEISPCSFARRGWPVTNGFRG